MHISPQPPCPGLQLDCAASEDTTPQLLCAIVIGIVQIGLAVVAIIQHHYARHELVWLSTFTLLFRPVCASEHLLTLAGPVSEA